MMIYVLKEAFKSIGRAKFTSLFTVVIITIAILFSLSSLFLIFLSSDFESRVKERIIINLFLEEGMPEKRTSEIENILKNNPRIKSVVFMSKEDARQNFIKETGEDFMDVLETNPLPASFAVKFIPDSIDYEKFDALVSELQSIEGIEDAVYDANLTFRLIYMIKSLSWIIYAGALLFVILGIFLVYMTIRVIINHNIEHYNTMKLVGAKLSTIKLPLWVNSVILGMVSSVICLIILNTIRFLLSKNYSNLKLDEIIYFLNIASLIFGFIFPLLGSFIATRKISLKIIGV